MNAVTRMSAKGQIVIPKDVRDALGWPQGTELEVVPGPTMITLRERKPKPDDFDWDEWQAETRRLINHDRPVGTDEDWNKAIDEMFRTGHGGTV